jgi:hypothetical protein
MKRGSNALECGSLDGDNMISAVQRITGINLGTPLQYADQTAALQLGHYATKSVLGAHVTRLLAETEADPGLSSFRLSEAVRKAAAAGQARRITRHNCGPTTKKVKQPPVARNASEWHRLGASVEVMSYHTPLLKEEVFDDTSLKIQSSQCCLENLSPDVARAVRLGRCWLRVRCRCAALLCCAKFCTG